MLLVIGAAMISLAGPGPGSVSVELRWQAPAGCPDREQMMMRMLVPPGDSVRDPVQVSATVQRRDHDHWVLDLELSTPSGSSHRRVDARDCKTLADTTAIVTAVYLGGYASGRASGPEPGVRPPELPLQRPRVAGERAPAPVEPPRTPAPEHMQHAPALAAVASEPVFTPTARRASPTRTRRDRDLHGAAYVAAGAGGGLLPGVDVTVGLGVALFGPRWRVELAGTRWFPRRASLGDEVGVDVDVWSGRIGAGPRLVWRNLAFPILGHVEVGAAHGRGTGANVVAARDAWAPWIAAGVTAGLSWAAHPNLALWLRGSGFVSLYRPQFLVDGVGSSHVGGAGGGSACAGLEVRFPRVRVRNRSNPPDAVTKN